METIEFVDEGDYAKLQAASDLSNARPRRFDSMRYDAAKHEISLHLARGIKIVIPVAEIVELAQVQAQHLHELRLFVSGEALVLSAEDVHISTSGLLRDLLALFPPEVIAAQFAASGGARRSAAKKAASAANGKLGGRPKKNVTLMSRGLPRIRSSIRRAHSRWHALPFHRHQAMDC